MSKTPRTDEHLRMKEENGHTVIVSSEFARQLERELAEARADVKDRDNALAAIMAVLPDDAKPCDAPDLIKHFKSQMLAYGSEYIRVEKQLKEARAEIAAFRDSYIKAVEISSDKDKVIEQLIDALLAARGIIEEGSTDLEADLLQPDKVIGQIDAVLQSITGDNQ